MQREFNLYIFDLDGTLVDAYLAIQKSLNRTRETFGFLPIDYDEVKKSVGRGDKLFIENFFPKEKQKKALILYRKFHRTDLLKYTKLISGARKILYLLKRKNKKLALASNRPRYFTEIILKKLDLKKYFDKILCADQIGALKPNPKIVNLIIKKLKEKKENTVFIGDMNIDVEVAKRASIWVIFVEGGSTRKEEIPIYNKKIIISSLKEIEKFIKS